jgi:soluble lytic murein transglycosylase-like protein
MLNPSRAEVEALIRQLAPPLDPELLIRQCEAESSFDQSEISKAGCIGLFQLEPSTAKDLGVDPYDWRENVKGGITYDKQLYKRYGGNLAKMLAAYNWGLGHLNKCMKRYGADWRAYLPTDTKKYLKRILQVQS